MEWLLDVEKVYNVVELFLNSTKWEPIKKMKDHASPGSPSSNN